MKRLTKYGARYNNVRTSVTGRAGTARYRVIGKGGIRLFIKYSAAARFAVKLGRASIEVRTETDWLALPL